MNLEEIQDQTEVVDVVKSSTTDDVTKDNG